MWNCNNYEGTLKSKSLRKLVVAKYRHKNKVEAEAKAKVQEGKKMQQTILDKNYADSQKLEAEVVVIIENTTITKEDLKSRSVRRLIIANYIKNAKEESTNKRRIYTKTYTEKKQKEKREEVINKNRNDN